MVSAPKDSFQIGGLIISESCDKEVETKVRQVIWGKE